MRVPIKKDEHTGDLFLDLEAFKPLVNTDRVKSYTLEPVYDDKGVLLLLTLYDSRGRVVQVKKGAR